MLFYHSLLRLPHFLSGFIGRVSEWSLCFNLCPPAVYSEHSSQIDPLKITIYHTNPLLKNLKELSIAIRVNTKVLKMVAKALCDPPSYCLPEFMSDYSLRGSHSSSRTGFRSCCCWKMPMPEKFYLHAYMTPSLFSFKSFLKWHFKEKASDTLWELPSVPLE